MSSVTRTFHPVGHGAFYTEKHMIDGDPFTIVYDCGSMSPKKIDLKNMVEKFFTEDQPIIDILFISHFDEDHINGIEFLKNHCNIKRVVMPLLDEKAKILAKVKNIIRYDTRSGNPTKLIDSFKTIDKPEASLKDDTMIIKVNYTNGRTSTENSELYDIIDLNTNKYGRIKEIESASRIHLSLKEDRTEWYFIPFNYKYDERSEQFAEALKKVLEEKN